MYICKNEQGTQEWFADRAGIPTGSNMGKLVSPTGKESTQIEAYAEKLACEFYFGALDADSYKSARMAYGNSTEEEAREAYEFQRNVTAVKVGFITDQEDIMKRTFGSSPDSLVGDSGILEIKCPIIKTYIEIVKKGFPKDYIPQMQGLLRVTGREWVDLLYYVKNMPLLIQRYTVDEAFQETLGSQITEAIRLRDAFYLKHLVQL